MQRLAEDKLKYYLGAHHANWLQKTNVPLFLSFRQLKKRKKHLRARGNWALDSGAFSEIQEFGKWKTSPEEYACKVQMFFEEIGNLEWASIQDWVCTPLALKKTGLSIKEHQKRTIENYCKLTNLTRKIHWIPILQGWDFESYLNHIRMYEAIGIQLNKKKVVGVGSLAVRQRSNLLPQLLSFLSQRSIAVHAFGLSLAGLLSSHRFIVSADSMVWSYIARWKKIQLPQCVGKHKRCNNCIEYALKWRKNTLEKIK